MADRQSPHSRRRADDHVIVITDLVKRYPRPGDEPIRAVDGLSLTVRRGETLAVLGTNGAGKTTTLEIVEGLTPADGGTVRVLGLDPNTDRLAVLDRIGIQLQSSAYFEHLRLHEMLDVFGRLYSRRISPAELLERVGLTDKAKALVSELSGGQAQRFSIIAALVGDPELILLDEPSTGLDPRARIQVWDLIRDLAAENRTIVLTTHYMEEAQHLADRIAFIQAGRIVAIGTPRELIDRHGTSRVEGGRPGSEPATLEDVFMNLTGRHLHEPQLDDTPPLPEELTQGATT